MKKILTFLFSFLLFSAVNVYAEHINQFVFFGDSLTDNGNLYHLSLNLLPKSPPYFKGRFSNGPTWAENVGIFYKNKSAASYKIYAYGGATAAAHLPRTNFFAPTTLELEINKYLLEKLVSDKSKTLFTIWVGGNDYLFYYDEDANSLTQRVVEKISWAITTLNLYGAKNFLILNLPDLARTPFAKIKNAIDKMHTLSVMHNIKLDQAIKQIKSEHSDINISFLNIYDIFNDFIDNMEKYNKKYHKNVKDTTQACWNGGFYRKDSLLGKTLVDEIQQTLAVRQNQNTDIDQQAIYKLITETPSLNYTYAEGRTWLYGNVPCANADEYLFWDSIHPTAVTHEVLSQIVIETLGNNIG
jgi:phospholipase/lecithinase/hemolysin